MTSTIFQSDAQRITNSLFECKAFRTDISRKEMNDIEDLIQYFLQNRFEEYKLSEQLLKNIEENRKM